MGLVVACSAGGEAFAYPINILNFHEMVNDTIGGVPLLITYALDASVVSYLAGRSMARHLPSETPMPFTSRTWSCTTTKRGLIGSRWAAKAVVGTLTGARLEPLPSATMPLGEWRALYPDTLLITGVEIRLTPPTPYDKLRTPKNRHIFIRYKAHACPFKRVSSWNP